MSIEAFRLQNFMAFADTGWIQLQPITLLFGRNSSGKSAIIRALRLLKQSLSQSTSGASLTFVAEDGVDLGSFSSTVYLRQLKEPLIFHFRCRLTKEIDRLNEFVQSKLTAERKALIQAGDTANRNVDLSLSFGWDHKLQQAQLIGLQISCPWEILKAEFSETFFYASRYLVDLAQQDSWTFSSEWEFHSDILLGHEHEQESIWQSVIVESTSGFLPDIMVSKKTNIIGKQSSYDDYNLVKAVLAEVRVEIQKFLFTLEYLGPLRPAPQRVFFMDRHEIPRWKRQGLNAYLDFLRENVDTVKLQEIDRWLALLGLGKEVFTHASDVGELGFVSQVAITESGKLRNVNLIDIGFGASQVLPILALGMLKKEGEMIIIEQPELHLHPRAQAILGDFFVDMSARGIRFILETHSEHLFLRLRRRIAETSLYLAQTQNKLESPKPRSSFRIVEISLKRLQKARVAKYIIQKLQSLKKRDYLEEQEFLETVENKLGRENTKQYRTKILENADRRIHYYRDDLSAYILHRDQNKSEVRSIEINDQGEFQQLPPEFEDFFADDALEIMKITDAALQTESLQRKKLNEPDRRS